MIYTPNIRKAIRLAIETHEINNKQKRKGKDIPYITHPLIVGLILANAGAKEEVIIAGILHDTIEDSTEKNKVTKEMIFEMFGKKVADLVLSVTEQDRSITWEKRKKEALDHIENFSHDSVLLKSADIIANASETKEDYNREGDATFSRFGVPKEKTLEVYKNVAKALIKKWPKSPLKEDLDIVLTKIKKMSLDN